MCHKVIERKLCHPMSEPKRKLMNYIDYGMPENHHHNEIRLLAGHILEIICFIEQNHWDEANNALLGNDTAKLCGLRIDSPFKVFSNIDEAVAFTRGRACFLRNNMKILLPQVAIGGNCFSSWKYPSQISTLAKAIFPIWLEEWIHAFQYLISGLICDESATFQKSPGFKDTWDINEVDVFAMYRNLGWNVEMLFEMENRYDERIAFADFSFAIKS